jgi:2-keto-3-deoxy-L-rhamnonate aldolase RhmA
MINSDDNAQRRAARTGGDAKARQVVEHAKAQGKYTAMFCFDSADARAMQALGYPLRTIRTDQSPLSVAARSELVATRPA